MPVVRSCPLPADSLHIKPESPLNLAQKREPISLDEHTLHGKRLISPWNSIATLEPVSWRNHRLPESLWAALCRAFLSRDLALAVFRALSTWAGKHVNSSECLTLSHSEIAALDTRTQESLSRELRRLIPNSDVFSPLLLLPSLPDYDFWKRHTGSVPLLNQWDHLKLAVLNCFDHQSESSTDVRWFRVMVAIQRKRLLFPSQLREQLSEIVHFPYKGDLQAVRPAIRATESSLMAPDFKPVWPDKFWSYCAKASPVDPMTFGDHPMTQDTPFLHSQCDSWLRQLEAHWKTTRTDSQDYKHDVVFGAALASVRAAEELVRLNATQSFLGLASLRFIAESLINLKYLLFLNNQEDWARFRQYAAGRAKLLLLKSKRDELNCRAVDIDFLDAIASEDKNIDFVDIELVDWTKDNIRKRSEMAGCKDIYDHYFDYGSLALHANWFAIGTLAFTFDGNPLHRAQRIPRTHPPRMQSVAEDVKDLIARLLNAVNEAYPGLEWNVVPIQQQQNSKT